MQEQKSLIITGSSGSFGEILTRTLAADFKTIYGLDVSAPKTTLPANIKFVECDLTQMQQLDQAMNRILSEDKDVVGLVNVAGFIASAMMLNPLKKGMERLHDLELWNKTIELNLTTTFKTTLKFAENMFQQRRKGVVVNISSVSAEGNVGQTAYAAAKAGVEAMTRVWSKEFAPLGIRCNCVSPGFFDTPSTHQALGENEMKNIKAKIPSKQLGHTDALVQAVEFCLKNEYFNGRVLKLDGGISL